MIETYVEELKEQVMMNQFSTHPLTLKEIAQQLTLEHNEDQIEIAQAYEQVSNEIFEIPSFE